MSRSHARLSMRPLVSSSNIFLWLILRYIKTWRDIHDSLQASVSFPTILFRDRHIFWPQELSLFYSKHLSWLILIPTLIAKKTSSQQSWPKKSWTSQWNDRSNPFSTTGCSTQLHLSHSIRGTLGCKALCAARRRWWDQQGTWLPLKRSDTASVAWVCWLIQEQWSNSVAMRCECLLIISTFHICLETRLLWCLEHVVKTSSASLYYLYFGFKYVSEMRWCNTTSEISIYIYNM